MAHRVSTFIVFEQRDYLAGDSLAVTKRHQNATATTIDHTTGYQGITGPITIAPRTGNRTQNTVVILNIDRSGNYVINHKWATAASFPLPARP